MLVRISFIFYLMFLCILTKSAKTMRLKKAILHNHGIRYCEQQCMATCECQSFSYHKETLRCVMFNFWSPPRRHFNAEEISQSKWAGCPRGRCAILQPFFLTRQHGCKGTCTDSSKTSKPKRGGQLIIKHAVASLKYNNTIFGFERKLKQKNNRIQVADRATRLNKIIKLDIKGLKTPLTIVGMTTHLMNQDRLFIVILCVPKGTQQIGHLLDFEEIDADKERQTVSATKPKLLNGGEYKMTKIKRIALDKNLQVYAIYAYEVLLFKRREGQYKGVVKMYKSEVKLRGIHVLANGNIVLVSKNFMQFFELKQEKMKTIGMKPAKNFTRCYVSFSPNSNHVYYVFRNSPYNVKCFGYDQP